jgi:hypothetical protein
MRELYKRAELALRIVCYILAALVVWQLAGVVVRWNPFHGVTVPELPALTAATNSPAAGAPGTHLAVTPIKGTNGLAHPVSTNPPPALATANTNPPLQPMLAGNKTNSIVRTEPAAILSTNAAGSASTNASTNIIPRLAAKASGTNTTSMVVATNNSTGPLATAAATNSATSLAAINPAMNMAHATTMPGRPGRGMNFNPFQPPGRGAVSLSPALQSRISRITDSEILGPVMHPQPMALMGIAGEVAFLRSDSGQTGLVKVGDSLDDLKLLRIGINRVLIEQGGQKKELTIFSGYGGESLMPDDSTNENKHP